MNGDREASVTSPRIPTPVVLLVDDEPLVAAGLRRSLRGTASRILVAHDGPAALDALDAEPVDVIVSDLCMPGMSGMELLRQVRERHPSTARVMLTGQGDLETAVEAINVVGVHRFLLKPVSGEALAACIREMLVPAAVAAAPLSPSIAADFERALDGVRVVFQPVFTAASGDVFAFEVLCRSSSPLLGRPQALFGAARQLGRVGELEQRVHERFLERLADCEADVHFLLNVEPASVGSGLFGPASPLYPHAARIVLEITESSALADDERAYERIAELRRAGFRVALDDLGAGYSNLNTLTALEPELVKYDGELLRDLERSPIKPSLVRSINAICRQLGIGTVAEGLETELQVRQAVDLGCDYLQGHHLSRELAEPRWSPGRGA